MTFLRLPIRFFMAKLFRLSFSGERYLTEKKTTGLLVVSNHCSPSDWLFLAPFLPSGTLFFLHPQEKPRVWLRRLFGWIDFFVANLAEGEASKRLEQHLRQGGIVVLFPESIPSGGGSLGKIYDGLAMIPHKSGVPFMPIFIHGTQFQRQSPREPGLRRAILPKVNITAIAPRHMSLPTAPGEQRLAAERAVGDALAEAQLAATQGSKLTLWQALHRAAANYGYRREIVRDATGQSACYRDLLFKSNLLGRLISVQTEECEHVGVMLPTTLAALVTFFALQAFGRIPALLNFTLGVDALLSSCHTAKIKRMYTSRTFIQKAKLENTVATLSQAVQVIYLEDLKRQINALDLIVTWLSFRRYVRVNSLTNEPAVILFTSGSEGKPKGVVLSHDNLMANICQVQTRVDLNTDDVMLNVLPMFHAFGLTVASLTCLFSGVRAFYFPAPLDYHTVAELAYTQKATVLAGTDTFLAGYGRKAHACDFYSMRHVFAGAEPLRESTRRLWMDRFGLRILEGYGATETSPVLSLNTASAYRSGSVGRCVPGVEIFLEPVPGLTTGGHLCVRGANIMMGYLLPNADDRKPPSAHLGAGWYATGDIVTVDAEGFLRMIGRAKRFAKIGGEMVSLAAAEAMVATAWPDHRHVVLAVPDRKKGESLWLVTDKPEPKREILLATVQSGNMSLLLMPAKIIFMETLPVMASGKVDLLEIEKRVQVEPTA